MRTAAAAAVPAMRSSAAAPVARAAAGHRSTPGRHPSQWWCKVHRPARSCITRSRSILISPRIRTPPRCCRITLVTRRWSRQARTLPPLAPCPQVCPASPPATPRYVWCVVCELIAWTVQRSVSQMRGTSYLRYDISSSENIQSLPHSKVKNTLKKILKERFCGKRSQLLLNTDPIIILLDHQNNFVGNQTDC